MGSSRWSAGNVSDPGCSRYRPPQPRPVLPRRSSSRRHFSPRRVAPVPCPADLPNPVVSLPRLADSPRQTWSCSSLAVPSRRTQPAPDPFLPTTLVMSRHPLPCTDRSSPAPTNPVAPARQSLPRPANSCLADRPLLASPHADLTSHAPPGRAKPCQLDHPGLAQPGHFSSRRLFSPLLIRVTPIHADQPRQVLSCLDPSTSRASPRRVAPARLSSPSASLSDLPRLARPRRVPPTFHAWSCLAQTDKPHHRRCLTSVMFL